MSSSVIEEAEVVVVGGGPSGSVAAAKLAELGHEVLLVDQSGFPREKPCGDGLTHASVAFLERHGLGDLMEASQRIEDVRGIIGHGKTATGIYRPWPQPPQYARVTTRLDLDEQLFGIARSQGARFLQARVDRPLLSDGTAEGVVLTGPDGDTVKARCVIAADGATSRMRRTSGFERERLGTHIYALRLYATTEVPLDPVYDFHLPLLYEGGLLAGYGWVFPVAERRANIGVAYYEPGLGMPRARIRRVLSQFIDELTTRSAERVGELSGMTEPIGAPIATQFSRERCELGNVIFAGEAARAADPLNGEGISFALHSGESAAEEAHQLLTSGRPARQGERISRRFTRIGTDLSWPARMVAAAPTGLTLVDSTPQPFIHRIRRAMGFGLDDPVHAETEVHRRLGEADPGCGDDLERANARILDSLDTHLPFAVETMHREVRSEDGPFAAAIVVAVARGNGADPGEGLANAAAACELLSLIASCYPEISDEATTELARFNNTLALLTGELVLARAIENGGLASAEIGRAVASAAQVCATSLAEEDARKPGHVPSVESHFGAIGAQAGAIGSLAARSGALLSGANGHTEDLSQAAHHLSIAWEIGNEIRDVTTGDEVAGRPPGAGLRGGRVSLPLIHALDLDPSLAEVRLSSDRGSTRRLVDGIRATAAIDRAAEDVATQVDAARTMIDAAGLSRPEPLRALADLSLERLPHPA